ncbi:MAG: hypothetical protein DRJ38_10615 [Thermoprotei archaeon]|nr:MAG: hypothetical protein DRJ38_10615 [Thermoprotei archaeon]
MGDILYAHMNSGYKSERVKATTLIWIAILSSVLTVLWTFYSAFLPAIARCTQSVSVLIPASGIGFMGLPFVMFIIAMILARVPLLRKHLTTSNLVYSYITTFIVSYIVADWGWASLVTLRPFTPENVARYVSEFVAAPKDVAELLWIGAGIGNIPWQALLPNIVWGFLLLALFGCMAISFVSIFRRQWIDVEMLPFPHIMVGYVTMVNVEGCAKREWPSKTPFLLGMLLGILLAIPLSGATLFPWFPDLYGWRSETCGPGGHWVTIPGTPWHLAMNKHPPVYALLLLSPVHALFSLVFWVLVMEIALWTAFYGFGYYTSMAEVPFCGRNWCPPNVYMSPPISLFAVNAGATIGLAVSIVILQRRYILETLRAAFSGSRSEEEAVSYRVSWIVFALSFILIMLLFMYTGLSPWASFVVPLIGISGWALVTAQMWGRIGIETNISANFTPGLGKLLLWPTVSAEAAKVTSTDLGLAPWIAEWYGGPGTPWMGSVYATLAAYKMAKFTNVHPRNVLKVLVVAMFTTMLFTNITQILFMGAFGARGRGLLLAQSLDQHPWTAFWSQPVTVPLYEASLQLVVGFIFMILMTHLYGRILWLPNPMMAPIAWSDPTSLSGIWFPCLVSGLIKWLILRIFGSRFYEERVVPFVGGFLLGDALEVLITALTSFALFPPTV